MTQVETGWNNSMTFDGCSTSWVVDHNATSLFGNDFFWPPVRWFLDNHLCVCCRNDFAELRSSVSSTI